MAGRKTSGGQRDPYAVLGVEPTASAGQITSAYRRLVRALHPDADPGTAPGPGEPAVDGRFADVVAAYGTLRDPALRAAYDSRLGAGGPKGPPKDPPRCRVPVRIRAGGAPAPSVADVVVLEATVHPPPPGRDALIRAGPTRVAAPYDGPGTPRPYPPTGWDLLWKWDAG
ncbi:J domain-containing protein [Streptomyces sp. Wb2n-11]|uniref:J domain-containing protein n=1 Tax=Streptomyces sp. Wb2n-11 TaxID=1030533 RepID=UPI000A947EF3|nr:J domain-containing protein [Streptomyces sp. Wb2n-11]